MAGETKSAFLHDTHDKLIATPRVRATRARDTRSGPTSPPAFLGFLYEFVDVSDLGFKTPNKHVSFLVQSGPREDALAGTVGACGLPPFRPSPWRTTRWNASSPWSLPVTRRAATATELYSKSCHPRPQEGGALAEYDVKKEWSEWERWASCKPVWVQSGEVAPHLVLKSRVCYRWKPIPEGVKAKARIVVAGFRDPHLTVLTRDAPVLVKTSFHLILQWAACHTATLHNGDCILAFLQGEADTQRP